MFSSIKIKLTFYYSILLIFILSILGISSYLFISQKIKINIDKHLKIEVDEMIYTLVHKNGKIEVAHFDEWEEEEHLPNSTHPIYVEIIQNDKVVLQTENIITPLEDWSNLSPGYYNFIYNKTLVRSIIKPIISDNDTIGYINTSITLKELDDIQNSFISIALFILFIGVIVSFVAGYIITKRFLAPILHISNQIKRMKTTSLVRLSNNYDDIEIVEITNELNYYLDRLEKTINSIKQFSADASHEIKTPLTIMKSDIEQAIKTDDKIELIKVAHSILDEIQRLQDITDKLTQLSLIENGNLEIETETIWLNDVLFNEINRIKNTTIQKGIVINTSNISSVSWSGDKNWLDILFRNIIDNAVKYSFDNNKIDVDVRQESDYANVSIRDYGTGVSKNELDLLTNRFFRSDRIESSTSGSGLGLSICNWIIKKHKGRIKFKSHRPGLEVKIKLPIK